MVSNKSVINTGNGNSNRKTFFPIFLNDSGNWDVKGIVKTKIGSAISSDTFNIGKTNTKYFCKFMVFLLGDVSF